MDAGTITQMPFNDEPAMRASTAGVKAPSSTPSGQSVDGLQASSMTRMPTRSGRASRRPASRRSTRRKESSSIPAESAETLGGMRQARPLSSSVPMAVK